MSSPDDYPFGAKGSLPGDASTPAVERDVIYPFTAEDRMGFTPGPCRAPAADGRRADDGRIATTVMPAQGPFQDNLPGVAPGDTIECGNVRLAGASEALLHGAGQDCQQGAGDETPTLWRFEWLATPAEAARHQAEIDERNRRASEKAARPEVFVAHIEVDAKLPNAKQMIERHLSPEAAERRAVEIAIDSMRNERDAARDDARTLREANRSLSAKLLTAEAELEVRTSSAGSATTALKDFFEILRELGRVPEETAEEFVRRICRHRGELSAALEVSENQRAQFFAADDHLKSQINGLAEVLLREFGGPTRNESAGETAIRFLRKLKADLQAAGDSANAWFAESEEWQHRVQHLCEVLNKEFGVNADPKVAIQEALTMLRNAAATIESLKAQVPNPLFTELPFVAAEARTMEYRPLPYFEEVLPGVAFRGMLYVPLKNAAATREQVYDCLDGERDYQDEMKARADRPDMVESLSVGETIAAIDQNLLKARSAWYAGSAPHGAAIDYLRKVGGLVVACMEQHGVVPRKA